MRKITTVLSSIFILLGSIALAHEGHKHVMGTVAAVAADHLQVKTKDGKAVTVPLTKATHYLKGKEKAAPADVHVGDRVVVDLAKGGAAEEVRLASAQAVDPVCGMKVDPKTALSSTHAGKTYYFCSKEDKAKFDKNPGAYVKKNS
jgi:YHS domain-containing protein